MTRSRVLTAALMATAALALALSSCSSSSSDESFDVTGHQTTLSIGPTAKEQLERAGVTIKAVAPAKAAADGGIVFPVTGGSIRKSDLKGSVKHSGGLTFSTTEGTLTFTDPTIDTTSGLMSATVQGNVNTVLQLTPLKLDSPTGTSVVVSGTASTLFSGFSVLVDQALGVTPFQPNQQLGPVIAEVSFKE